jgi:hypothetical protein
MWLLRTLGFLLDEVSSHVQIPKGFSLRECGLNLYLEARMNASWLLPTDIGVIPMK